jgi:hypothetical protein
MQRVPAVVLWLALAGCGGSRQALEHPLTNRLDPAYGTRPLRVLAALPFGTDVSEDEDPDQMAAGMVESKFYPALNAATGYTLLPASEVRRALEQAGMQERLQRFYRKWITDQEDVDEEFLREVAAVMHADALVGGAVDLWHQDAVDLMDTGAARTHVGLLLGLFDGATGRWLWLGRDANFRDGVRYPGPGETNRRELERQLERTNLRTAGGVYAPPDFSEVVELVVEALVGAFPPSTP